MAYYDALISVWTAGKPAAATGATYAANAAIATKLTAINTWTVAQGSPNRAWLAPSDILNAIVPADIATMTQMQVLVLTMLLSGTAVDASQGSTIRAAALNIFAGKTTTLANLAALVAPYDSPTVLWRSANGYVDPLGTADVTQAGLS